MTSRDCNRRILFTVHESPQLPRELWDRFKAVTRERGDTWITVLRQAIDRYLADDDKRKPS